MNRLEAESRGGRQGRLADHLCRMDFVVLDELGYLPFALSGGQLLFHLVIHRSADRSATHSWFWRSGTTSLARSGKIAPP